MVSINCSYCSEITQHSVNRYLCITKPLDLVIKSSGDDIIDKRLYELVTIEYYEKLQNIFWDMGIASVIQKNKLGDYVMYIGEENLLPQSNTTVPSKIIPSIPKDRSELYEKAKSMLRKDFKKDRIWIINDLLCTLSRYGSISKLNIDQQFLPNSGQGGAFFMEHTNASFIWTKDVTTSSVSISGGADYCSKDVPE